MPSAEWKTDSSGLVMGFNYHDSCIERLQWGEGKNLSLFLREHSGAIELLRLEQPTEICIERFYNGAIVSDIFIWKVEEVPSLDPRIQDAGWNALAFSRYGEDGAKRFAGDILRKNPGSYLVVLNFSYGGTISAVRSRMTRETPSDCD